ncbi:WXG100 family type VII secretion target [Streptomyces lydicus]|uniref:WXG100 family type VII secretion target n=1 Tax=Streptomyces lydicus TaxID=47763 RepID=UPI00101199A1|nr:WXG100 family type VII secretion target [Streptomyces lydicus]MCZ1007835.1 WXG100 family type VII secretion target [Streptomyces lydicus]
MAGNQPTSVDVPGMRSALPHFEQGLMETRQAHKAMFDQLTALRGGWQGDAAVTFEAAVQNWIDNCDKVHAALQVVFEKLEATTGKYESVHGQTSDEAASLQSAIAAGLPGM